LYLGYICEKALGQVIFIEHPVLATKKGASAAEIFLE
jgi:hypothetical protein